MTKDDNISVAPLRLNRGGKHATTHGFYARNLTSEEADEAERMEAVFRAKYDLDDEADLSLLRLAIRSFILAARPLPNDGERATNTLAARTRLYADLLDRLNLSRRERLKRDEEDHTDEMRRVFAAIFSKPTEKRETPSTFDVDYSKRDEN